MTTADRLDGYLSSITPQVWKLCASADPEVRQRGRRLVAEILDEKLNIVAIPQIDLSQLNAQR